MIVIVRVIITKGKDLAILIHGLAIFSPTVVVPAQFSQMIDGVINIIIIGVFLAALKAYFLCCLPRTDIFGVTVPAYCLEPMF